MIKEGKIVPSEVTVRLLQRAMEESGNDKFLIDGFPRNDENRVTFESVVSHFFLGLWSLLSSSGLFRSKFCLPISLWAADWHRSGVYSVVRLSRRRDGEAPSG